MVRWSLDIDTLPSPSVIRYNVVPPLFLIFFTVVTQWLVAAGHASKTFSISSIFNTGTLFSWSVVLLFLCWSFLSLKVPSKTFNGPMTPAGYIPVYSANGTQYYLVSLMSYFILIWRIPSLPLDIWSQFDDIIATLNIFSLGLCLFLLVKGNSLTLKSREFTLV